jgi:plastocyanin
VTTIRGNEIVGNRQDGIQLIDYFDDTNRLLVIERNLIKDAGLAGIGLMDNGASREDFRAASIREPIRVFHNTFVDNDHGISGGDNLIALNNIFRGHTLAMKNVDANSIAAYNIFWNNAADAHGSNIDAATTLSADPLLDASSRLGPGSPAINAGTAHFEWRGEVVMDQPSAAYNGAAPDLGWLEHVPVAIQGRVTVADFSFKPATLEVDPGSVVQWLFRGPSSHAATDSIGLGAARAPLFDSGPKGTGEVYKFKFVAAGQYPYSSTASAPPAMTGTIMVPVTIAPITGSTATRFTVTWASKSLSGFGFSVQSRFKREGSSTFTTWTSFGPVQTAPSAVFVPDRGPGTYQFRSQLRNATTGAVSLRSTPTSITVTS